MNNDELKRLWQSPSKTEKIKYEKSHLIDELVSNLDMFDSVIKSRDKREIITASIIAPICIVSSVLIPYSTSKVGFIIVAVWCFFVIYKLKTERNSKPSEYFDNQLMYLVKFRQYLLKQKQLLDNIFWWYILPCVLGMLLIVGGFIIDSGFTFQRVLVVFSMLIVVIFIYNLNKKEASNEFVNRISQINDLLKIMES